MSPYIVARQAIYWKFPSSTFRLAYVATIAEVTKLAWQASDDTLWMLVAAPDQWVQISTDTGTTLTSNVVASETTIPADKSMTVASYLKVEDTLNVSGNLLITG